VDKADPRCAAYLTMQNLSRAFALCADRYTACPIYQELLTEERKHDEAEAFKDLLATS